jgi:hypothetical protein
MSTSTRRARLRRHLPALVLAAGWAIALATWLLATPVDQDPEVEALRETRSYERQIQVIGGKFAMWGAQLSDLLDRMTHGRGLAYTLAAAAALVALAIWAWDRAGGDEREG